jgi:hypothetical protein
MTFRSLWDEWWLTVPFKRSQAECLLHFLYSRDITGVLGLHIQYVTRFHGDGGTLSKSSLIFTQG